MNNIDVIDTVWLFIASDHTGEGLPAFQMRTGEWMPMVACDAARVASLRRMAQMMADEGGIDIKLIRLTQREDLETFKPRKPSKKPPGD